MMKWVGLTEGVYVNLEDAKVIRVEEPQAGKSPRLTVFWNHETDLRVDHPFDVEKILKALDKESV